MQHMMGGYLSIILVLLLCFLPMVSAYQICTTSLSYSHCIFNFMYDVHD